MPAWRRTLYILTVAEFMAVAGFTVIMPFLPYFVQELGVTDPDQVKLWTGRLFAAQAVSMAAIAPVWGTLADRYSRKLMVERAMFGGALVFMAMGLVQNVYQLLALRILQGFLTGTVPAATALVASTTPRERSGSSLGILQTGIFLGASFGPLAGGVISDHLGYQAAFWTTSVCLLLAGLAVHLMVSEESGRPEHSAGRKDGRLRDGLLIVLRSPALRGVFLIRMLNRLGTRIMGPMLPLFVQQLVLNSDRLATITGVVTGSGALAAAAGSVFLGRASDRSGHRKVLVLCTFGMGLLYLPLALVITPLQLGALQVAVGFVMAGALASIAALLATRVPEGRQGAVYGVNTTIVAGANALAPMLGASIAVWWGLRAIFVVAAGLFAVGGLCALWLIPSSAPAACRSK